MSLSPPIRRLSTASKREEDLINAYEAEEERIINILSRKLEQLREEKISLENTLEAESELHVNRLSRELSALRLAQQQAGSFSGQDSPEARPGFQTLLSGSPGAPTPEQMLDAMRRENEDLRTRLVTMERDYIRVVRLNDIYREELIDHRGRLGLPVDNLIGISSSAEPLSQPVRRRPSQQPIHPTTHTTPARPTNGHTGPAIPTSGVPIPRPSSRIYRPTNIPSESSTPLSHSPASACASTSESPSISPLTSPYPYIGPPPSGSVLSNGTALTTPASIPSLHATPPAPPGAAPAIGAAALGVGGAPRILSYPSVPPPSVASSFGSPTVPFFHSSSPVDVRNSRRNSGTHGPGIGGPRIADPGSLASRSQSRGSAERAVRVAETGSLARRAELGREELPATPEDLALDGGEGGAAM